MAQNPKKAPAKKPIKVKVKPNTKTVNSKNTAPPSYAANGYNSASRAATVYDAPVPANRKLFSWALMLFIVTVFQIFSFVPVVIQDGEIDFKLSYVFLGYILLEWLYLSIADTVIKQGSFELEIIAFFLSGIGLSVCGSIDDDYALKQLIAIVVGIAAFSVISWMIRSTERSMALRMPIAFAAVGLLALNLLLAKAKNGALNWITIGPVSVQPSEFVKIAFIFVGAATLEKLQTTRSLTKYVIFSIGCVGALFLMRDFGTALIFFFTFIIIAFMRSGDIRTIILVCAAALLGAVLIIYFKPYVANRFSTYRHVWDYINDAGYQQTRALIYSASGGLFGLGLGQGKLRNVFAASTDLIFGLICEEWGILLGILIVLIFAFIAYYAVRGAQKASSTFYAIAAVSAAGMMLFQLSLNVFGVTDLLPMTGVTLPFISRGGSSLICSWSLFAFIKSVSFNIGETRPYKGLAAKGGKKS